MMFVELPLSTRTLLVLNPSIISMMTSGSSWGCFTPLASSFEKHISWFVLLCFRGGRLWTLFTCLWRDFLRDLNDPHVDGSPMMIFISPVALCGWEGIWSLSLWKLNVDPCYHPWSCWNPLSSRISTVSLFVWAFLSAPSGLNSPLCNARDLCENYCISSYHVHWATSAMVWLFEIMFVLNLCQNLVDRHRQRCELHWKGVLVISSSTPFDILTVCAVPFLSSPIVFFFFLLLLGFFYPLYGCQDVLNIHVLLCLQEHFYHRLKGFLCQRDHEFPRFQSGLEGC